MIRAGEDKVSEVRLLAVLVIAKWQGNFESLCDEDLPFFSCSGSNAK